MPKAARKTDLVKCRVHGMRPILEGFETVIVGGLPAARMGDEVMCPETNVIDQGEPTVWIGFRDAARVNDNTAHFGFIKTGCESVLIGSESAKCFIEAALDHFATIKAVNRRSHREGCH